MSRVMLRLSLVLMLTLLVSACAVRAVPPLARAVDTEAVVGRSPMAPLIAGGGGLALGAGILAGLGRRRRRRGDAGSAGWSVVADVPGHQDASFSLAPVVDEPSAAHIEPDAAVTDPDDEAADDDATTSWLGQLAEPEPDDAPLPASPTSAAERASGAPDTPWWIDEAAGSQEADDDELGAEPLAAEDGGIDRTARIDPPRGPSDGR